jgi:phospholipid transport system transporter-binding protein
MFQTSQELNQRNAAAQLQLGRAAIAAGETDFDLSALTALDSTAVAAMLDWQRHAAAQGKRLRFHGVSASLSSLISLYGVTDLLLADGQRH